MVDTIIKPKQIISKKFKDSGARITKFHNFKFQELDKSEHC